MLSKSIDMMIIFFFSLLIGQIALINAQKLNKFCCKFHLSEGHCSILFAKILLRLFKSIFRSSLGL